LLDAARNVTVARICVDFSEHIDVAKINAAQGPGAASAPARDERRVMDQAMPWRRRWPDTARQVAVTLASCEPTGPIHQNEIDSDKSPPAIVESVMVATDRREVLIYQPMPSDSLK
jgi:hypothetical protein